MAEGCVVCRGYRARYYAPSRLILRRQMEIKRRQDAAARLAERRNKAAKRIQVRHMCIFCKRRCCQSETKEADSLTVIYVVQQWYKRLMGWRSLYQRFRMQKLRLDRAKENKLQHSMALRIQVRGPVHGTSHSYPLPRGVEHTVAHARAHANSCDRCAGSGSVGMRPSSGDAATARRPPRSSGPSESSGRGSSLMHGKLSVRSAVCCASFEPPRWKAQSKPSSVMSNCSTHGISVWQLRHASQGPGRAIPTGGREEQGTGRRGGRTGRPQGRRGRAGIQDLTVRRMDN